MAERKRIVLACDECGSRNYKTTKSAHDTSGERLHLMKYCSKCLKHTGHSETK